MKKKIIKIFTNTILLLMIISSFLSPMMKVEAKTVKDLREELQDLQNDATATDNKIKYTNSQIRNAENSIDQLYKDIDNIAAEIVKTTEQITQLSNDIFDKKEEIKSIVASTQITNGESIYIDYIVGADSMTDFIFRMSVAEQLLEYNYTLIADMNGKVEENNQKKEYLKQQEIKSKQKQQELYKNLNILGREKKELYEYNIFLADEIKIAQEILDMYVKAGCKDNEDIKVCASKLLPPDTRFWRPLDKGYVTSEYGWRIHPISKTRKFHDGMDLSNSDKASTKVYAAANGKVAATGYLSSIGNYVYIHHSINGQKYTTTYLHLKSGSIKVKPGDVVNKNTVIATMGTTGDSTGVHLHFAVAKGLRGQDYVSYAIFVDNTVNPRDVVNLPSGYYIYWYDRTSKYY